jgi:PAS domain S-box-containing protein
MTPEPRRLSGTVVAAGLAVVALVAYLLFTNHASAIKVRENLLAHRADESRSRALAVGHLLASAAEDLRYLAESREVAAFYESRDLGMSMEYGLALALVPIRERLAELASASGAAPGKFRRVAIVGPGGELVADSGGDAEVEWPDDADGAAPQVLLSADGTQLFIARPLDFKGRPVALVLGWVRTDVVLDALGSGGDTATFLLDAAGRPLRGTDGVAPAGLRDLPADGRTLELPVAAGGARGLAVRVPVPGQPLTVVQVDRVELLGDVSPRASALQLAVAAGAVLAMFALALRMNTRSLVLSARLTESLRREREVGEKHAALEREVSARRRLEEANAVLAMAVDQAAEGIAVVDDRGLLQYANAAFQRMAACGGPALGRPVEEVFQGVHGAENAVADLVAALERKELWKGELRGHRADGAPFEAEIVTSPVHDERGQLVRCVLVAHDVTEQNLLRERLRHSQKLEAIGTFAGGVAHDFRNLLTVMRANGELCLGALAESHPAHADVLEILKAVDRAANLTRQLLAFGRRQVLNPEALDVNGVVGDVEAMLRRLVGERVQLHTVPCSALPRVRADRGQLEQVLVNLVVNARDAMPNGGRLTVATGAVQLDEAEARRLGAPAAGEYVKVSVADTGVGIDARTLPRIFEPFFTTKPQGKGTGLGLATVYGVVEQSRGCVAVRSAPNAGATFEVYLPAATDAAPAAAPVPAAAPAPNGRIDGIILLVEDEEQVRAALQRQLVAEGYSVLTAADGRAASKLLDQHPDRIDLLLSDVVMPHLGGRELARLFRVRHPGAKVILMSGYSDEAVAREGALEAGAFIEKPLPWPELAGLLRRMLGPGGRERPPGAELH